MRKLFNWFRYNFRYGIENLIKWFFIIWKDRDCDYCFIYYILQHKLKFTEEVMRDGYVNSKKDADKIKKCVLLLNRLIKDEYSENIINGYNKRFNKDIIDHAIYLKEQDLNMLFEIMKKNIEGWWN